MVSTVSSVDEYVAGIPDDRRSDFEKVRNVILANLPPGYEEGMQYGMAAYFVPHSLYPKGYHCDPKQPLTYAMLGSQKNYMSLYLMTVYGDSAIEQWFVDEYKKTGKKLDMGKSCVRFKRAEDLPMELIGQTIARVP